MELMEHNIKYSWGIFEVEFRADHGTAQTSDNSNKEGSINVSLCLHLTRYVL
jgi:hypothetical protein